ncbi:MAG: SDR family NAD(P)-dependent oxidoreductase [Christensenellales bacterium]
MARRAGDVTTCSRCILRRCAGALRELSHTGLLCDMTDAQWRAVMDVNVSGCFTSSRARAGHEPETRARLWRFQHVRARRRIVRVAYSASKAAVIGLVPRAGRSGAQRRARQLHRPGVTRA